MLPNAVQMGLVSENEKKRENQAFSSSLEHSKRLPLLMSEKLRNFFSCLLMLSTKKVETLRQSLMKKVSGGPAYILLIQRSQNLIDCQGLGLGRMLVLAQFLIDLN